MAVGLATFMGCLSGFLIHSRNNWKDAHSFYDIEVSTDTYAQFTGLMSLVLVFRTSQAYSRFWNGCDLAHQMTGDWFDAVSTIVAFTKHSEVPLDEIESFKHLLIRLVSLLNAMVFADMHGRGGMVFGDSYELVDVRSLSRESLQELQGSVARPEVVFQWVQSLVVEQMKTGVMSIPAPLLARIFVDLGAGMVKYHEARKFASIPFPFPYAATAEILLIIHSCLTTVTMAKTFNNTSPAVLFSFLMVFILWSIHLIAAELDNPFENDTNDLDMQEMQEELNVRLVQLLRPSPTPMLNVSLEDSERNVRRRDILHWKGKTGSMWGKLATTCTNRVGESKSTDVDGGGEMHLSLSRSHPSGKKSGGECITMDIQVEGRNTYQGTAEDDCRSTTTSSHERESFEALRASGVVIPDTVPKKGILRKLPQPEQPVESDLGSGRGSGASRASFPSDAAPSLWAEARSEHIFIGGAASAKTDASPAVDRTKDSEKGKFAHRGAHQNPASVEHGPLGGGQSSGKPAVDRVHQWIETLYTKPPEGFGNNFQ